MSRSSSPVLYRASGQATGVGALLVEVAMTVPRNGIIKRVRADVTVGTAINQVQASIRETAGGSGLNVLLAYALGAEPLDSEENIQYMIPESSPGRGVLYFAVAVDNLTADHTVDVRLEIQAVQ